jgi:thiamine-phosphate pyrophosphorylase
MIFCVTNRHLCTDDFFLRFEKICSGRPNTIILREKDLKLDEYKNFAQKCLKFATKYKIPLIVHEDIKTALKLKIFEIHLSLSILKKNQYFLSNFKTIGVSIHNLDEALEAQKLGATYLVAGHIFDTDCKKNIPGRGIDFFKNICDKIDIPVFGIGGISLDKVKLVKEAGAKGICVMSEFMTTQNPAEKIKLFREEFDK